MKPHSINIFLLEGDPNGRRARPPQRAYSLKGTSKNSSFSGVVDLESG